MKLCLHCGKYPAFSHGYCQYDQNKRTDDKWLAKQRETKWTKPKQATSRKLYTIPKVSSKMAKSLKVYHGKRIIFLIENPICQIKLDGCTKHATTVHHTKGRIGELLNDVRFWKGACMYCHDWCELNPIEAKEKGFSLSRLAKV